MVDEIQQSHASFLEYFKKSRLLKVGLAFNLIYFVCVIVGVVYFLIEGTLFDTVLTVDFRVFYEAGQVFLAAPTEIYSVSPNGLPFRYFPLFAAWMAVFTAVPFLILYVINITLMMICNVGIVYLAYQVSLQVGVTPTTKNFERTLLFVFIAPQHIINIMFGQITQFAILLVLLSLYLVQSSRGDSFKWSLCVGLLVGLASTLKPFFLIFFPFLIPISILGRFRVSVPTKRLLGVMSGFLLSMLPNIVYFTIYPTLLDRFVQVNLFENLTGQHSTSVTNLILALLRFLDSSSLQPAIILILGGFLFLRSYVLFITTPNLQKSYLHHFADMMFLVLLVYPDSWFLFLAIWYAFLGPSMLQMYSDKRILNEGTRTLDLLWSGANNLLAFFSIGIILHYLVLGFDPIIPIWLIILYVLYHRVFAHGAHLSQPSSPIINRFSLLPLKKSVYCHRCISSIRNSMNHFIGLLLICIGSSTNQNIRRPLHKASFSNS